jgi:hypothetical protein
MIFPRAGNVSKPLTRLVPMHKGDDPMTAGQSMDVRAAAPGAFSNNEAYGVGRGFEFWYANIAVMDNSRVWNVRRMGLFFQYHSTAIVNGITILGGEEAIVGQHGTHLQLRDAEIAGASSFLRMEPNKRGIYFSNVTVDGVAQASPPYAPFTLTITPAVESTLSGIVTITVTGAASGKVQINIDGKKLVIDSTAPYSVNLNTNNYANGTHWISAEHLDGKNYTSGRFVVAN